MAPKASEHRNHITPAEYARSLGVNPSKVIGWIKAGDLRAINVAATTGTRPKFRIKPEDLAAFEDRRAAASVAPAAPTITRVRRTPLGDVPRRY